MIQLILGGARSGKSNFAEQLAAQATEKVCYIATATAEDSEMQARIARHRTQRPAHWQVREEPLELSRVIREPAHGAELLLVDCLTLWLSNQLLHPQQPSLERLREELCATLAQSSVPVILVSNEVGLGVVPLGEISRQFVDHAGWLNQAVARVADRVILISAGLPLVLKGPPLS